MLRTMLWVALLAVALVYGCSAPKVGNNGHVVGGSCTVSLDCAFGNGNPRKSDSGASTPSECRTGPSWPGGYCATSCTSDSGCPSGARCVDIQGGLCVVECTSASQCRSTKDYSYECAMLPSKGSPDMVQGCINTN